MSGSWQDWDSAEYMEFLEQFYTYQMSLADNIAKGYDADFKLAVFKKVAPPAVYLKAEYEAWQEKQVKEAIPEQLSTPKPDVKWMPTKTKGTLRCSERDATEDEMKRALDPGDREYWYMPPGEGYQYGLVFRKVKS